MANYSPRVVLVTGGAGFIGSNFVRRILERFPEVRVVTLDKLTYAGSADNLSDLPNPDRHLFVAGDINDRQLVGTILRENEVDSIVHFAAESHVDRSISGPAPFISSNIVGTYELLQAARTYWLEERGWSAESCRFHHISTDEVFGSLGPHDPPFREDSAYAPNSPYSSSKAASDHLVRAWNQTYGLPVTTSNCSNNYGPFQHDEKLIPTIIRACIEQQPIPIYGDGSNIRDWLYVMDHCDGIIECLSRGIVGAVYNFGSGAEYSNLEIAHRICVILDELKPLDYKYESLIRFVDDRPGHDWRYAMDISKASRELDWHPKEQLAEGLLKTVQWYLPRMSPTGN